MQIFRAIKGYFSSHPGKQLSSYGLVHPNPPNGEVGPLSGMPLFDGGEQFSCVSGLNLGLNAGHAGTFTAGGVIGNIQNLNSSAAGQFSPGAGPPAGWNLLTPATVDGWYSLRGVVGSLNVAAATDYDYVVAGVGRFALPATKTTRERLFFGQVAAASSRVAFGTAVPASGVTACGIMTTNVGFSGLCQGATAFGGGATVLGTFADFGITDNRYFTLGFRMKYSQTASKCSGEWWINNRRIQVPAANLASMVTTADARGMLSLTSADGVSASAMVLGAKVMYNYDWLQRYGV